MLTQQTARPGEYYVEHAPCAKKHWHLYRRNKIGWREYVSAFTSELNARASAAAYNRLGHVPQH